MPYISNALKDIGRGVGLVADGTFRLAGPPIVIAVIVILWLAALVITFAAFIMPPWAALEFYHYPLWFCAIVGFVMMALFLANKDFLTFAVLFVFLLIVLREYWFFDIFIAGIGSLFPGLTRSVDLTIFKQREK